MALEADLVGAKMVHLQAELLGVEPKTVAGVGTLQSGAAAITTTATLGTTAGGATAFLLPSTAPLWVPYYFINTSATAALVYPPTSGTINGGSANASISVAQNQSVLLFRTSTNAWYSVLTVASGSGTFTSIVANDITGGDSSLGIAGLAAAQGGAIALVGGTSSTSGNAGGAITGTGGTPGATGVGGAVTLVGGVGGASSGAGGAATLTGGAGSANAIGGVATVTGGAGQGTGNGAAASVVGGASGAGATGDGGAATILGGAAASTNGHGGPILLTGGAKTGTGRVGSIYLRGQNQVNSQVTPTAKTVTAAITAAELVTGIITTTGATGPSEHQLPTGTLLLAELPNAIANDSFDFSVINTGTGASDDATLTVNTDVTIVGNPTIGALTDGTIISGSGRFRARYTGGVTWVVYRIA